MQKLVNGNWANCTEADLIVGDTFRIPVGNGGWEQKQYTGPEGFQDTVYELTNITVNVNAAPAGTALTGDYMAEVGDTIAINAELVNGAAVNYGAAIIKLPIVKFSDGRPTQEEIYFNATIQNGVMAASGVIQNSGDWKLVITRLNNALDRINAGWRLDASNIGILV